MNPLITLLKKDKQNRILEGIILGLEANKYYDKQQLASALREYQQWINTVMSKTLDMAHQCEVNAEIKDNLFKYSELYKEMK